MTTIKNKKILIIAAVALLAGAGGGLYYLKHKTDKDTVNTPTGNGINYSAPTDQEKQDAEDNKKAIDKREAQADSSSSSSKKVTPTITAYGQTSSGVQVGSRVPGIIENNGTCMLILQKGDKKVSQAKKATGNASDTSCGFITITRDRLSKGTWIAKVTYLSQKAQGSSEAVTIEIN